MWRRRLLIARGVTTSTSSSSAVATQNLTTLADAALASAKHDPVPTPPPSPPAPRIEAPSQNYAPHIALALLGLDVSPACLAHDGSVMVPLWAQASQGSNADAAPPPRQLARCDHESTVSAPTGARLGNEHPLQCPARDTRPRSFPPARTSTFAPLWTRAVEPSPSRKRRRHPAENHPYVLPAYGRSLLRTDQQDHARDFAQRLANDRSAGRINAPLATLQDMALAVAEARADGVNVRTSSKAVSYTHLRAHETREDRGCRGGG